MEKSLTKKVLKNAATTEGIATIGGAAAGGWLGNTCAPIEIPTAK